MSDKDKMDLDDFMVHDGDEEIIVDVVDEDTGEVEAGDDSGSVSEEKEAPEKDVETRSYLTEDDDSQEDTQPTGKTVHISELIKERRRRQAAEAKLVDQTAGPAQTNAEKDPLAGFEDDDYLTAKDVRDVREHDSAKQEQIRQDDNARREQAATAVTVTKSENDFRVSTADYDIVMQKALDEGQLDSNDRARAMRATNPAKAIYNIAKSKMLQIDPEFVAGLAKTKQKPAGKKNLSQQEILDSDEDVIDEMFPEPDED